MSTLRCPSLLDMVGVPDPASTPRTYDPRPVWDGNERSPLLAIPLGVVQDTGTPVFIYPNRKRGHYHIRGGSGTGKTWMVRTLVLASCALYSPAKISWVLWDGSGRNDAESLSLLPHVAEVFVGPTETATRRFMEFLRGEAGRRDSLLQGHWDVHSYRTAGRPETDGPMPHLVVVMDDVGQSQQSPNTFSDIGHLARVSRGLGIHFILVDKIRSAMDYTLLTNSFLGISSCITFKDDTMPRSYLGDTPIPAEDLGWGTGRFAMTDENGECVIGTALSWDCREDETALLSALSR